MVDPILLSAPSRAAVARARAGEGPTFIEGKTYRWMGHYSGDAEIYRTKEEKEGWMKKDPITRFERILLERGILDGARAQAFRQEAEKQLEAAEKFAMESPLIHISVSCPMRR